jgi:hypothetical protein
MDALLARYASPRARLTWTHALLLACSLTTCLAREWPDTRPRFAVCFAGEARTLSHAFVADNIRKNLLNGIPGAVTAFAVFAAADATRDLSTLPTLNLTAVRFLDAEPLAEECNRTRGSEAHNAAEVLHLQWQKLRACYDLVTAHEAATGREFHYVIRARPDAVYFTPFRQWSQHNPRAVDVAERIYSSCTSHWPVGDQFATVPRALAHLYFHADDILHDCAMSAFVMTRPDCDCLCDACSKFGSPECYLGNFLERNSVPVNGRHHQYGHVTARLAPPGVLTLARESKDGTHQLMDRFYKNRLEHVFEWYDLRNWQPRSIDPDQCRGCTTLLGGGEDA